MAHQMATKEPSVGKGPTAGLRPYLWQIFLINGLAFVITAAGAVTAEK
jgi:hypothetical protein